MLNGKCRNNHVTLTGVRGKLTGQQTSQGSRGSGPGSNSVLLPGNRKRGHEPGPGCVLPPHRHIRCTGLRHPDQHCPASSNRMIYERLYWADAKSEGRGIKANLALLLCRCYSSQKAELSVWPMRQDRFNNPSPSSEGFHSEQHCRVI